MSASSAVWCQGNSLLVWMAPALNWALPLLGATLYLLDDEERNKGLGSLSVVSVLESIPDPAIIFGPQRQVIEANTAALEMLGRSREQVRGLSADEIAGMLQSSEGPAASTAQQGIISRALSGEAVRNERRVIHPPGRSSSLELLVSASPIRARNGKIAGILLIARDITELTQLQRRIGDMERHHAIGQMAAALAHDFNNVLDTIGQAVAVLELNEQQPLAERSDVLGMIRNAVRRGSEIISGVREYLRTGTGESTLVDVRQVLVETIELTRPLWQRARTRLLTHLQPVAAVRANAADLRRVFANLIINAIEAMPQGGELTISCWEQTGMVFASVKDSGSGILPEHQPKVFFPYFTTKSEGTGLGLSGAQKIVLERGGNISFQTQPGHGTTFTVQLPVADLQKGKQSSPAA